MVPAVAVTAKQPGVTKYKDPQTKLPRKEDSAQSRLGPTKDLVLHKQLSSLTRKNLLPDSLH